MTPWLSKVATGLWRIVRTACFLLGFFLFLVLFLEILSVFAGVLKSHLKLSQSANSSTPMPWISDFQREYERLIFRWEPFVYWRQEPFHGKTINIDERGLRSVWQPSGRSSKKIKVFVFGGSALWGIGARDEETIPSWLAKDLVQDGSGDFLLTNFSQQAYVSTQEVLTLIRELQKGNVPQVVVFYDGANDAASAYMNGVAGVSLFEFSRAEEFGISQLRKHGKLKFWKEFLFAFCQNTELYQILARLHWAPDEMAKHWSSINDAVAQGVVSIYLSNLQLVEFLGKRYGFTPVFFWQPLIYTKKHLSPEEERAFKQYVTAREKADMLRIYALVEKSERLNRAPQFHNFSHLLDENPESLYLDNVHLLENGNAIIAKKMAELILKDLSGSKQVRKF